MLRSDIQHPVETYGMGLTALLPLRRKMRCEFLSSLKVHLPRQGFNPQTLGPMVSTLTITSPRTTNIIIIIILVSGCTVFVRTLSASHRRFHNLIKTLGRTPLDDWSARRKGLYLHTTTQHRNTKTNIHASSGIRPHDPSFQAAKTYALDGAATGTGWTTTVVLSYFYYCRVAIMLDSKTFLTFLLLCWLAAHCLPERQHSRCWWNDRSGEDLIAAETTKLWLW
jgi:hypothetical protein